MTAVLTIDENATIHALMAIRGDSRLSLQLSMRAANVWGFYASDENSNREITEALIKVLSSAGLEPDDFSIKKEEA
jgi:hypothetical protein